MKGDLIRKGIDIVLPIVGIGLMIAYGICDTTCSALRGTLLGIDLKLVGILFMAVLLVAVLIPSPRLAAPLGHLRTAMLSGAIGGEILLVRFQFFHETFCPFCLAFGLCLVVLFISHFPRMHKGLSLVALVAGFAAFALFFEGIVLPRYT